MYMRVCNDTYMMYYDVLIFEASFDFGIAKIGRFFPGHGPKLAAKVPRFTKNMKSLFSICPWCFYL